MLLEEIYGIKMTIIVTPSGPPPASPPAIISGADDSILRKMDLNGTIIWEFSSHDAPIHAIAVDESYNIFTACSDRTVRKVDTDGTELWSFEETNDIVSVTVDSSGNVIIGSFDGNVRKLDSAGVSLWTYLIGAYVRAVAVDGNGYIYIGADDNTIRKFTPDGILRWTYTEHTNSILSIAVDYASNVYTASKDNEVHKINPNGINLWISYALNGTDINGIAVDNKEYSYACSNDGYIRKLNKHGVLIWAIKISDKKVTGISVDVNYNIYASSNDGTISKYTTADSIAWENEIPELVWKFRDTRLKFNCVATSPLSGSFPSLWARTPYSSVTLTPTLTPTSTLTPTPTLTPTLTPTTTVSPTVTMSPTVTVSPTVTMSPTNTVTPTISNTPAITATPTPTVTPSSSDAGADMPINNFIIEFGQTGEFDEEFLSVELDQTGGVWNVYSVGYRSDWDTLDYGILTKVDHTGTVLWQRTLLDCWFNDLTILGDYIYACGTTNGFNDGIIVKYNKTDGTIVWQQSYSTSSTSGWYWIYNIDNDGTDLYITGDYQDDTKIFLSKVNTSGVVQWSKVGTVSVNFEGSTVVTSTGVYAANNNIISKFDFDGTLLWSKIATATDTEESCAIVSMNFDGTNLLITGITLDLTNIIKTFFITVNDSTGITGFQTSRFDGAETNFLWTGAEKYGSEYLLTGYYRDTVTVNNGHWWATLDTVDNTGADSSTLPQIRLEIGQGGAENYDWMTDVKYDGTNIVTVGSYLDNNVENLWTNAFIIINIDDKVGLSGNKSVGSNTYIFDTGAVSGIVNIDLSSFSFTYGNASITVATTSNTEAAGTMSIDTLTY